MENQIDQNTEKKWKLRHGCIGWVLNSCMTLSTLKLGNVVLHYSKAMMYLVK